MCIIAVKPAGVAMPDEGVIRTMWQSNSDGAGFMYSKGGKVHIEKGFMKLKQLQHRLDSLRRKKNLDDTTVVLHFRIGTAGYKIPQNTHPFPVSSSLGDLCALNIDCHLGVVHNGIIPIDPRNKSISDTMEYIIAQLSVLEQAVPNFYQNEHCIKLIENATKSKMAFLLPDGEFYLLGHFQEDAGMFYSNSGYIPWTGIYGRQSQFGHWDKASGCYTYDDDYEDYKYTGCEDEPWKKQIAAAKPSEAEPELLLSWLNPEVEYIIMPDGCLGNADDWLIDDENNLYVYDYQADGCYLVSGARRVPLETKLSKWDYATAEPLPLVGTS